MPSAKELAKSLAAKFLENGNYEAFGALSHPVVAEYAQAAAAADLEEYFAEETGFSGLAVHSVGCTVGLEADEIIVYVTKGSRRALENIPEEIDGVPIEAKVMGKLKAGSPTAVGGLSNFYERNGRIACGSSCAPSAQNYSGTFGCLIRLNGQLMALSNNHVFGACNHTPSVNTQKPARHDHFKTGQPWRLRTSSFVAQFDLRRKYLCPVSVYTGVT